MVQFNQKKRAFEFFEANFSKRPSQVVSKINPSRCLACHRNDPRPNWDHYFFWPGAYGGDDDLIQRAVYKLSNVIGNNYLDEIALSPGKITSIREWVGRRWPEKVNWIPYDDPYEDDVLQSKEANEYVNFLRSKGSHPRYSHLAITSMDNNRYYKARGNFALNTALIQLNRSRIERKITDDLKQLKAPFHYAILGATYCGKGLEFSRSENPQKISEIHYDRAHYKIEDFIPIEILQQATIGPLQYLNHYAKAMDEDHHARMNLHNAKTGGRIISIGRLKENPSLAIFPDLAPVKYVMALAGLDNSDWGMNFSGMPIFSGNPAEKKIIDRDFIFSQLALIGDNFSTQNDDALCSHLAKKSIKSLQAITVQPIPNPHSSSYKQGAEIRGYGL